MVSAGELVYGKRRALPAHPVHAHPSSRSSHKPSDVVRPTETRCRFCAGRMSSYEVGEAVAISKHVLDCAGGDAGAMPTPSSEEHATIWGGSLHTTTNRGNIHQVFNALSYI